MRNYFMYENKRRNKFVIEYPKLFATDRHCLNIRIGKSNIAQVKHVKYLGVIIDEDLSWKPHIHNHGNGNPMVTGH